MKKILTIAVIFFVGVACGLILSYDTLRAQGSSNDSDVMGRLNDITRNQADMMTAINSIKEDVQIIKVRVTQPQ